MTDVLEEPVLVLNKNWAYIAVTSAKDAICALYAGGATAIDPENYVTYTFADWVERGVADGKPFIPASRIKVEVPEVIVLARYDKIPARALHYSKQHIFRRDHYCCQYCGHQFTVSNLTIDHVVPRSQGGETNWTNCVSCCTECNTRKADRTPDQAGMKLRSTPAKPDWTVCTSVRKLSASRKESWARFI